MFHYGLNVVVRKIVLRLRLAHQPFECNAERVIDLRKRQQSETVLDEVSKEAVGILKSSRRRTVDALRMSTT
jgi:hypothetical protein